MKDYCHSRNRWKARKYTLPTEVITSRIEPANRYVAEKLRITPGQDILYLERLRSIGDEKAMLIEEPYQY